MTGLDIEDLEDFDFLSNVRFSPDKCHIAFNKHTMDMKENEYKSNIWIFEEEEKELWQLTNSGKDKDFVWLSEEEILFISERDMGVEGEKKEEKEEKETAEKTKLFKINIRGGEAQHLDTIKKNVSSMKIHDSSLYLTVQEKIEDEGVKAEEEKKEEEKKEEEKEESELKEGEDYHELDEIPFWSNETGFSNKKRNHLYSYDLETKEMQLLLGGYKSIQDFDVKEKQICLNMVEYKDKMEPVNYIYHLDLEKDELSKLTEEELTIERVRFLKRDKIIFEATDMEEMGLNTNKELYIYDLEEERMEQETQMNKDIGNKVLTDLRFGGGDSARVEDERYYFTATEDHFVNLYRFDLKEGVKKLTDFRGTVDFFDIQKDEVAHISFKDQRPQELYRLDIELKDEERITDFNGVEKKIAPQEHFTVESNGKEIDAWIIKPVDFDENKDKSYP
ncbi:MAG: hypothetical protein ACOC55_02275, partial [Candidatus Natronoplasma sp.]